MDFYSFGSLEHPRVGWLGWWWPANSINFQANILGHDKLWMGWGVPIVHIFKSLHDGAQPIKNSNHESSSLVVMDRHVLSYFWHPSRVYDFRIKAHSQHPWAIFDALILRDHGDKSWDWGDPSFRLFYFYIWKKSFLKIDPAVQIP